MERISKNFFQCHLLVEMPSIMYLTSNFLSCIYCYNQVPFWSDFLFKITEIGSKKKKKKKNTFTWLNAKLDQTVKVSYFSNTHHDTQIAILDFGILYQSLHNHLKISRIDNRFTKIKLNSKLQISTVLSKLRLQLPDHEYSNVIQIWRLTPKNSK